MPTREARKGRAILAVAYSRIVGLVVVVGVLPMGVVLHLDQSHRADRDRRDAAAQAAQTLATQRAACARTNVLRSVVDGLLTTARARSLSQSQPGYASEYRDLRTTLRAVPHTFPASAIVNCQEAVK
jgi:hypothetical protein